MAKKKFEVKICFVCMVSVFCCLLIGVRILLPINTKHIKTSTRRFMRLDDYSSRVTRKPRIISRIWSV